MRTTIDSVRAIIPTGLENGEISAIMLVSNRMVTNVLGTSILMGDVLTDIETFLTAHIIAIGKERQTKEERVGDVWIKFNENKGDSLQSTTYGQMVLLLDTTGSFQSANKMKASIKAIPQDSENNF